MALTRAQLLMSNQSQGAVLAGQPVAVTAGSGITIDPNTGVISVNASTISGVMKLNNGSAYNAYQWPNSPGTNGQFLQTNGAGLVDWADVQGFAVVTVSNAPPTPPTVGELWFDCDTGTLNVYQNCVGTPSPNWFNVAQPGFPVLPGNTNAVPNFATGTGTQADPYDCSVTSVGAGTTVQILNTVTVDQLAPFQYVPIVDLNAVANGGRFSFTNNYANAIGELTFDIVFTDLPPSPPSTPYTALIKIGYGSAYVESRVNVVAVLTVTGGTISGPRYVGQQLTYTPGVPSGGQTPYGTPTYKWFADGVQIGSATSTTFTLTSAQLGKQITASTTYTDASGQTATGTSAAVGPVLANPGTLTITSPGSISPSTNVSVGTTLNYTAGTFTGGIPTVTPSWKWQRNGTDILGVAANATSYPTVSADANQAITVRYTVTDSATPVAATASQSTAAVTPFNPIPSPVWSPNPPLNSNAEAISSGAWGGTVPQTITASGCVEVSLNGTSFSPSVNITTAGATLYQRWKPSCVGQKSGDTITGSVDAGTQGKNDYSIQLDHVPSNVYNNITSSNVVAGATVFQTTGVALSGVNAPAYVTIASSGNTGTNIQAATSAAGPWTTLATTGTGFELLTGQTLFIRQTVGSASSTGYVANIQVGDDPAVSGAVFSTFTYTATTASSILPAVWSPTPNLSTDAEAISSGLWGGTFPQTITATGCVEVSLNGTSFSNSVTVNGNVTLYQRWKPSCVGQKSGDTIIGSVDAGSQGKNDYSIQLDHLPTNAYNNLTATGVALGADVVGTATSALAGVNAPAYVTIASSGNTGTNIQASTVSATGPWTTLATTGTTFPLLTGQNLYIKQTVGSSTSTPYVANIQVGDDPGVSGATFSSFSFTATTTGSAAFLNTTFTPTSPNAAPVAIVPFLDPVLGVNLNPVASVSSGGNTWTAGGTTLTGSNIQVSIAGATYAGSGAIANGQSLAVAWDVNYLNTLAHDANASGTISGTISGVTYTNSFGFQVKKSPTFTVPTGVINVPLGSTVNTGTMTVDGYNCPVTVSISAPTTASTATMTAVKYTVAGVGPTTLTVPGSFTIYPSQTLLIEGTVNSTAGDFNGLTITIGSATPQEWRVRNATATPAITTPSITSPSGSPPTLLNPALNSPAGITLQGDQYTPTGGASATQTSSTWQVYKANPTNPETSAIVSTNNAFVDSNWTSQDASTITYPGIGGLANAAYGGGNWIFSGVGTSTGGFGRSTNGGVTWTNQTVSYAPDCVVYDGTQFVAAITDGSNNKQVYKSSNGSSWSPSGAVAAGAGVNSWVTFAAKDSNTYVGSINGFPGSFTMAPVYTTNGGATWNTSTGISESGSQRGAVYDPSSGSFYIASAFSGIFKSTTGASWSIAYSSSNGFTSASAVANGVIVFSEVTTGSPFRVSVNGGTTWTTQTNPLSSSARGIAGNSSGFVAATDAGVVVSSDGLTWVTATLPISGFSGKSVSTDGTQFTIGGFTPGPVRRVLTGFLSGTELVLTDITDLSSMQIGDSVVEVGGGADATGTITAITPGTPSITVAPQSANWSAGVGATAKDTSRTVIPPAPPNTGTPDPTKYTAITGSPLSGTVQAGLTDPSVLVPQSALTTSSTYYARVQYATTNASPATSSFSNWSSFATAASFAPNPGTAMGGGYFAGQIRVPGGTGTIYNLIVAPVRGDTSGPNPSGTLLGQYSTDGGATPATIQYSTIDGSSGDPSSNSLEYGKTWSDTAGGTTTAGLGGIYPLFGWCKHSTTGPNGGGGIGGFTDWYIPAQNELAVLYFFLKPNNTANGGSSGANANSVTPYTPNTAYGPNFPDITSSSPFNTVTGTGTEAFSVNTNGYWCSTDRSVDPTRVITQRFNDGGQMTGGVLKSATRLARAIRRVPA